MVYGDVAIVRLRNKSTAKRMEGDEKNMSFKKIMKDLIEGMVIAGVILFMLSGAMRILGTEIGFIVAVILGFCIWIMLGEESEKQIKMKVVMTAKDGTKIEERAEKIHIGEKGVVVTNERREEGFCYFVRKEKIERVDIEVEKEK